MVITLRAEGQSRCVCSCCSGESSVSDHTEHHAFRDQDWAKRWHHVAPRTDDALHANDERQIRSVTPCLTTALLRCFNRPRYRSRPFVLFANERGSARCCVQERVAGSHGQSKRSCTVPYTKIIDRRWRVFAKYNRKPKSWSTAYRDVVRPCSR